MIGELTQEWEKVRAAHREKVRLVSLYAATPGFSPLALVRGGQGVERFFWAEPEQNGRALTLAGVGVAAEVRVPPVLDAEEVSCRPSGFRFEEIRKQAKRLFAEAVFCSVDDEHSNGTTGTHHPARPRLFGGFAFQDDFIPDVTWSTFSPAHFILPHYQLAQVGQESYLTINALLGPEEDPAEAMHGLREALLVRLATLDNSPATRPTGRPHLHYPMTAETWRDIVIQATDAIQAGAIEKVVLSRVCEIRTDESIDAVPALDFLNDRYADSYRFLFEPVPHHAFFGATPELLIHKSGSAARTMALAGSIARGNSPAEDDALANALLASPKDRHEHKLVVEMIRNQLTPDADGLLIPGEPGILRLRNIQHLLTPIEAQFGNHAVDVLSLARRLHPTPALGGVPADRAVAFLRRVEPVPRGWYAAPVGWLDSQADGAFAVAIRSAVTRYDRAWLYAGAGIVGDSQPEREWAETALKFRPMLGALGVGEAI